jgi:ketosteroid isomerase-like protein
LTEGNVAIVRRAYAAVRAENVEELRGLTAPHLVLRTSSAIDSADHHGPEAIQEVLDAIHERWEDFSFEPLEFYEGGNRVLVLGTLITKGRAEEGFATTAGQVWTLEEGKVTLVEGFTDSEQAIRASGLTRLLT